MSRGERWNLSPAPIQGSSPTRTFFPFPTFHIVQDPTKGMDSTNTFQTIDPLEDFTGVLNQSITERFRKYFEFITLIHMEFPIDKRHRLHPARSFAKSRMSFRPYPPNSFGRAKSFQLARWMPPGNLRPTHNKQTHSLLILSRTPFGIVAMEFQFTEILSRMDFNNTR